MVALCSLSGCYAPQKVARYSDVIGNADTSGSAFTGSTAQPVNTQGNHSGKVYNIAVLDLVCNGTTADEGMSLTNRLRSELFKTSRFDVLERGEMTAILKEQAFQQTGCTSTECIVEAGKLLNVQLMAGGSVSKVGNLWSIDLRLIDVGTAKIVAISSRDTTGGIESVMTAGLRACAQELSGRIH